MSSLATKRKLMLVTVQAPSKSLKIKALMNYCSVFLIFLKNDNFSILYNHTVQNKPTLTLLEIYYVFDSNPPKKARAFALLK